MTQHRYPIPAGFLRSEIEVQRSRFITSITAASTTAEAAAFVARIKQEFPDANHNCWAYLVGPPGSCDQLGLSDDGEPHGAAGKPMLTVLQHAALGDVVAVVTRYFGGIKLGKGGMVKAYTQAMQNALKQLARTEKIEWRQLLLRFDYTLLSAIERSLPDFEAIIGERCFTEQVDLRVSLPCEQVALLTQRLNDLAAGQVDIQGCSTTD